MYFCAEFYGFARNSIHIFFLKKKKMNHSQNQRLIIFSKRYQKISKRGLIFILRLCIL